jgi:hypothetical protein
MVEHFLKKQEEAKTVAKEEDIKSNMEMTEGENEVSVRYIRSFAEGPRHKYAVSERPIKPSRLDGKRDKFV